MFVMMAPPPQCRSCNVINDAFVCNPNFRPVLAVAESQLTNGVNGQTVVRHVELTSWLWSLIIVYKNLTGGKSDSMPRRDLTLSLSRLAGSGFPVSRFTSSAW